MYLKSIDYIFNYNSKGLSTNKVDHIAAISSQDMAINK